MKYLLLLLLVLSTSAMTAEKKVAQATTKKMVQTEEGSLDVEPKDKTKEMADKTGLYTNSPDMKANVSCKEDNGHELKAGDKGYEECLKKHKAEVKVEFKK